MRKGTAVFFSGVAILLSIALCGCSKSKAEFRLTRIIDGLRQKDFAKSPLFNLLEKLPKKEDLVSPEDLIQIGVDKDRGLAIFGCALDLPALGGDTPDVPPALSVFRGSESLPYAPLPESMSLVWSYVKRTRRVAVNRTLFKGERWSAEFILPAGTVDLTVLLSNPQPRDFAPRLRVEIDGRTAGDMSIGDQKRVRVSRKVTMGRHKLGLVFDSGTNLGAVDERGAYLRIEQLFIVSPADLLLLALPVLAVPPPGQSYRVSYTPDPRGFGSRSRQGSVLADYASLYSVMSNDSLALHDAGVAGSLASFKKKVHWKEGAINIILAPPSTTFIVTADLPGRPFLEFGYGILEEQGLGKGGGVNFRINLETRRQKISIFDKTLQPGPVDTGMVFSPVKVDLSRFRNQRVKLIFSTEASGPGSVPSVDRVAPAFWSNPVLFSPVPKSDTPINVILISLDTLRADHLGCYGYPRSTSPRLDGLASDGIRFDRTLSPSAWTLPAHVSMLTSLTPAHHGVLHLDYVFDPGLTTLADLLRRQDYVTGAFTGGGYVGSDFGFAKGFDFYVDENMGVGNPKAAARLFRNSSDWIKRNADKKFFLFLHSYQPHDPYSSPAPLGQAFLKADDPWTHINLRDVLGPRGHFRPLGEREKANVMALYDGDIRYVDEVFVGPLIRRLKDLGLYDRTMIIVTSDHGEEFFDHGSWLHGGTLYEELIRVPLIVKLPRSRFRGRRIGTPVQSLDILPTILEELKIPYAPRAFDGRSLLASIRGRRQAPREIWSEVYGQVEFPSFLKGASPYLNRVALMSGSSKFILSINNNKYYYFSDPLPPRRQTIGMELYELDRDPGERTNLASARPDIVRRLMAKIEAYFASASTGTRARKGKRALLDNRFAEKLKAFGYIH